MVENASYVIFSYDTPIAWRDVEGRWFIPSVTYSRTTSKHQGMCRAYLPETRGVRDLSLA
jgi:hypothetical protein